MVVEDKKPQAVQPAAEAAANGTRAPRAPRALQAAAAVGEASCEEWPRAWGRALTASGKVFLH